MEKVTIRGEEITVHEMPVRAGVLSEWEKDVRRVLRDTVSHIGELLDSVSRYDTDDWERYTAGDLVREMGGANRVYPLLSKPARMTMEWVNTLSHKEFVALVLAVYEANKRTFDAIFAGEFGPATDAGFMRLSMNALCWKLAEYGYNEADVLQMPLDELRNLYQDVAQSDKRKREEFLRLIPNVLGMVEEKNEQGQKS